MFAYFCIFLHISADVSIFLYIFVYLCICLYIFYMFAHFCIFLVIFAQLCIFLQIFAYFCIFLYILIYFCIFVYIFEYMCKCCSQTPQSQIRSRFTTGGTGPFLKVWKTKLENDHERNVSYSLWLGWPSQTVFVILFFYLFCLRMEFSMYGLALYGLRFLQCLARTRETGREKFA